MLGIVAHWFASLSLGAAALLGLTNPTTPPDATSTVALSPEEVAVNLHNEITDLRNEVERIKLEAAVPLGRPLAIGSRGDDVRLLQQKLAALNFLTADLVTGYYGAATTKAVKNFQNYYVLEASGVVDRATLDKLFEVSIANLELSQIYFPEEETLLGLATSSEAALNAAGSTDTAPVDNTASCQTTDTAPATTTTTASTSTSTASTTKTTTASTTTTSTTTKTTTASTTTTRLR